MKNLYKKRLYTNVLSLSAAVLCCALNAKPLLHARQHGDWPAYNNKTETWSLPKSHIETKRIRQRQRQISSAEAQLLTTTNQGRSTEIRKCSFIRQRLTSTTNESETVTLQHLQTRNMSSWKQKKRRFTSYDSTVHMSEKATHY